jgi:hypothetical protein
MEVLIERFKQIREAIVSEKRGGSCMAATIMQQGKFVLGFKDVVLW